MLLIKAPSGLTVVKVCTHTRKNSQLEQFIRQFWNTST